jgi:hypothetical protein
MLPSHPPTRIHVHLSRHHEWHITEAACLRQGECGRCNGAVRPNHACVRPSHPAFKHPLPGPDLPHTPRVRACMECMELGWALLDGWLGVAQRSVGFCWRGREGSKQRSIDTSPCGGGGPDRGYRLHYYPACSPGSTKNSLPMLLTQLVSWGWLVFISGKRLRPGLNLRGQSPGVDPPMLHPPQPGSQKVIFSFLRFRKHIVSFFSIFSRFCHPLPS